MYDGEAPTTDIAIGGGYFVVLWVHGTGKVGSAHRREFDATRRTFRLLGLGSRGG